MTSDDLCNHAVRSFRELLLTWAETLETNLYILKKNSTSTNTPLDEGDCTTDQESNRTTMVGENSVVLLGVKNGAGMHSVTNLQGRYEADQELAN